MVSASQVAFELLLELHGGERGSGCPWAGSTGTPDRVALRQCESPGAPPPLQRAHGPTPLLHACCTSRPACAQTARGKVPQVSGIGSTCARHHPP
eukprot:833184-Prymnesium_polylepis.3